MQVWFNITTPFLQSLEENIHLIDSLARDAKWFLGILYPYIWYPPIICIIDRNPTSNWPKEDWLSNNMATNADNQIRIEELASRFSMVNRENLIEEFPIYREMMSTCLRAPVDFTCLVKLPSRKHPLNIIEYAALSGSGALFAEILLRMIFRCGSKDGSEKKILRMSPFIAVVNGNLELSARIYQFSP